MVFVRPQPTSGLGELAGAAGRGIGSVLQGLAQQKAEEMAERHKREAFKNRQKAAGVPDFLSNILDLVEPKDRAGIIENALAGGIQFGNQQPSIMQTIQGQSGQQEPTQSLQDAIQGSQGQPIQQQNNMAQPSEQLSDQEKYLKGIQLRKNPLGVAKLEQTERLAEKKYSQQEQAAIRQETKQYYDETLKAEKTGQEIKRPLDRMEKLIKDGKLPPAALYKFVKDIEEKVTPASGAAIGGTLGALAGGALGGVGAIPGAAVATGIGAAVGGMISPIAGLVESGLKYAYPDAEEFEKLSNGMISGAKELFGSRITDLDLKAFLQTIPNLMQTDNGKLKIINNIRIIKNAAEVRANAMKEIIKENKGKRPENLPILVEERAKKELDDLAYKFVNG